MITRLLIPTLLAATVSLANAQPVTDQALLMASAASELTLLPVPSDLQRHTEKVAEFRLQEISQELSEQIDRAIKARLEQDTNLAGLDPS